MYKYYVSYIHKKGEDFMFCVLDYKIDTEENIKKVVDFISRKKGYPVIPIFWKSLKR